MAGLIVLLFASNWLWLVFFVGYRRGIMEAIDEHRKKFHED